MSVDIDWSCLNSLLTAKVEHFLTEAFATAPRPNYIGEIGVTSFSFGDAQPVVELLDLRDVYKEFLEDDEEDLRAGGGAEQEAEEWEAQLRQAEERKRAERSDADRAKNRQGPLRPPFYSQSSSSLFSPGLHHSLPSTNRNYLPSSQSLPLLSDHFDRRRSPLHDDYYPSTPSAPPSRSYSAPPEAAAPARPVTAHPSLQMHLLVKYSGNMNVGISTSLVVNYPASMFMSLPLKLSITSIGFEGIFVVAFEGDRQRVHLSILDPRDGEDIGNERSYNYSNRGNTTAGARLLHSAVVDSEVGQAGKHVLKNVGKVEKFVLDVMRSTLESELVFPFVLFFFLCRDGSLTHSCSNFQTVMF